MLSYLRESLHWIFLLFCKPLTLEKEIEKFTGRQTASTFLKVYPVAAAICSALLVVRGGWATLAGYLFNWQEAFSRLVVGLIVGLVAGLIGGLGGGLLLGLSVGLVFGLGVGQFGGLVFGLLFGLVGALVASRGYKLVGGLVFGLAFGAGGGLVGGLLFGLLLGLIGKTDDRVGAGLFFGLFFGLVGLLGVGLSDGLRGMLSVGLVEARTIALALLSTYLFATWRPHYLLPYVLQYFRANHFRDPFLLFHNSPIYWGEVIATPLPRLKDWLANLATRDHERGMKEILFVVEKHPYQRKAAFKALLAVTEQDLQLIRDLNGLASAADLLKAFPVRSEALPKGLDDARRYMETVSTLARDYQTRLTSDGQLKVLEELRGELKPFHRAMALTAAPVSTTFQPLAARWLGMVRQAEAEARARLQFSALPNPFVAGNPLQPRDFDLLKGRRDIIRAIEKYILNTDERPTLLLYGRRRTGKSSTLLNLPRLLSSRFEPVYTDCQDAKWHESDQAFCYNLAREIFERLFQSDDVKGIRQPQETQFEKNAFTRLDEYLDQFERLATERGKRILLAFDEYEGLEESIAGGDISKNVLGKLRNIIQHRQRIVVLVSGSHRFEELTSVNWASYLINTRTLELSFLDEPSARELLTEPVPQLRYEDGVLEEILRLTHCQPYLLQAVASELVNHLNELEKTTATRADLGAAVNKVLTSAGAYFANTWREDNSATEQTVLRAYAEGAGERVATAEFQAALQSLIRKEMMERDGDGYRLAVPLFGLWILRNQVD